MSQLACEPSPAMMMNVINVTETWASAFPNKFKFDEIVTDRFVDIWAIALQVMNATDDEILMATAKSITKEWPPSSPYDFIALVRGRDANAPPNHHEAYIQAANGNYLHPAAYAAAKRFGFDAIRVESAFTGAKKFKAIYDDACAEYAANPAQYDAQLSQIQQKTKSDTPALPMTKEQLQRQSDIATAALAKMGIK